jgi:hypothetical protein
MSAFAPFFKRGTMKEGRAILAVNNNFMDTKEIEGTQFVKNYAEKEKHDSWMPLALVLVLGLGTLSFIISKLQM